MAKNACSIHWDVQVPKETHNCPQVLCVTVLCPLCLWHPQTINYSKLKIIARNFPTRARQAQTNPSWISKNIPSTATPCAPGSRHLERKNSISVNTIKHIKNCFQSSLLLRNGCNGAVPVQPDITSTCGIREVGTTFADLGPPSSTDLMFNFSLPVQRPVSGTTPRVRAFETASWSSTPMNCNR